jgi:hypothetical protein
LRWLGMAGMAGMGWKGGWCMGHGAFLGWVHRRWSVFMR